MLIIRHRINTVKGLMDLPKRFGAEIDIRSFDNELIINHSPFKAGIKLKEWLKFFDHRFIIFNIKEEGIEFKLLDLLNDLKINNYFFLDHPFLFSLNILIYSEINHQLGYQDMKILIRQLLYENLQNGCG